MNKIGRGLSKIHPKASPVGKFIEQRLRFEGSNVNDLAERSGISVGTIFNWRRGTNPLRNVEAVLQVLGFRLAIVPIEQKEGELSKMIIHCPNCGHKIGGGSKVSWGGWEIDENEMSISTQGKIIRLRPIEVTIISILLRAKGRIVSRDFIMAEIYPTGNEPESGDKIISVTMACFRKKAREQGIKSSVVGVWKAGYKMERNENAQ